MDDVDGVLRLWTSKRGRSQFLHVETSNPVEYTWDNRNRLTCVTFKDSAGTVTKTVAFAYDYLNRWIATEVDNAVGTDTSEYFVYRQTTLPDEVAPWDRAAVDARDIGQITLRLEGNRDFTDGKETADIANRYLWGPAVDQILADEQTGAGVGDDRVFWPLADHQGTARDLAELRDDGTTKVVQRRTHDAYGNVLGVKEWNETAQALLDVTAPAVDHLFGFTGRPTEGETGLQNNLNRWYDPEVGTWLNEDPINFRGGDANLYRYCGNDPVNYVDPSGLDPTNDMLDEVWCRESPTTPLFGLYLNHQDIRNQIKAGAFVVAGYEGLAMALEEIAWEIGTAGLGTGARVTVEVVAEGWGIFRRSRIIVRAGEKVFEVSEKAIEAYRAAEKKLGHASSSDAAIAKAIEGHLNARKFLVVSPRGVVVTAEALATQGTSRWVGNFYGLAGKKVEEIIARIPRSWKMVPQDRGQGIKFLDEMGYERIRIHGPSPRAPAGSNSAAGWTLRIMDRAGNYYDAMGRIVPCRANSGHIPIYGNPMAPP